ncbi:hypothetical protein Pcinc_038630 [Petrolisthes cinctipes]|uniref:BZIP domain-containing protein n=1 Tax=Petrolisthes cinctipes TaxID=88211 RepID=A0AAE1BQ46_PETCI|nr:hypothetical protein Pcinc_038630 [Petrolisthes cinctipes]
MNLEASQSHNSIHSSHDVPLCIDFDPRIPRELRANWSVEVDTANDVINEGGAYFSEDGHTGHSWELNNYLDATTSSVSGPSLKSERVVDEAGGSWRRRQEWRHNSDRDEVLEDVSTWSLDTIRQVASSLHQQGVWQADDTPAMASWEEEGASALTPMRSWHSDVPSTSTTHAVISTPTAEFTAQPDINSPQASLQPKTRKKKMYQWEPQQDPQLEKKRLRALRQFRKRQQEEQYERNLKRSLTETTKEVDSLREEAATRLERVKTLETQLTQALRLLHQHQNGGMRQVNLDRRHPQPYSQN